jgi:hypothetical protein
MLKIPYNKADQPAVRANSVKYALHAGDIKLNIQNKTRISMRKIIYVTSPVHSSTKHVQ